jgi:predicted nucleotidyltransferase
MDEATRHLRLLASQVVEAALERVPLRGALLAGSAGRGDADFWSDIDLLLYVDVIPPEETLDEIRKAVGGTNPVRREQPTEHFSGEEFELEGVRTEVSFATVARTESRLDELLDRLEAVDSPLQKSLSGILHGLPLHGHELIGRWQARLRDYPEPLRRAMILRHWRFHPLWYHVGHMSARDAELWRLDTLLDAAFDVLGVLAGLNRVYFARFQLTRLRAFIATLPAAPPDLADRLESLFSVDAATAAEELGRLVAETRALVRAEFPDLELPLRFATDARQSPWRT